MTFSTYSCFSFFFFFFFFPSASRPPASPKIPVPRPRVAWAVHPEMQVSLTFHSPTLESAVSTLEHEPPNHDSMDCRLLPLSYMPSMNTTTSLLQVTREIAWDQGLLVFVAAARSLGCRVAPRCDTPALPASSASWLRRGAAQSYARWGLNREVPRRFSFASQSSLFPRSSTSA
jgi:hypothetical protein